MNAKETALSTLTDLVIDYLYYDRKGDEELTQQEMQELIESGELTAAEIVERFTDALDKAIKENFNVRNRQ